MQKAIILSTFFYFLAAGIFASSSFARPPSLRDFPTITPVYTPVPTSTPSQTPTKMPTETAQPSPAIEVSGSNVLGIQADTPAPPVAARGLRESENGGSFIVWLILLGGIYWLYKSRKTIVKQLHGLVRFVQDDFWKL
ncbi:hypothetical protein A2954_02275 [Candidatus Roizmanbacteria bacterium RIFCSPLOWO2_01_FULL_37_12]|uniref:Uncharacterized protein n=1 Tax=Candidatus Roizmanbacteria bacterium RIFCSPLOWO2_01_FULL_37_12 TaxID=1802056 RepID=A0A1F7I8A0_9BACT|nr:MAG: hypothetical protein A2954_02275 [Candidatus Roizmanbacteria bacterium RIFCSPLOWO2_01_FULL_37_12]